MGVRKTLLLVEDNKQEEILTLRALQKHGVQADIVVCRDGTDALDWVFARGKYAERDRQIAPSVILLDLKLPKLDGHEVLAALRENPDTKQWPVVIMTTSKRESDVQKCYDHGANSYVQKPVNYKEFLQIIENIGTYWLKINENPPWPKENYL